MYWNKLQIGITKTKDLRLSLKVVYTNSCSYTRSSKVTKVIGLFEDGGAFHVS
jgi:hypothetical protein